MRPGLGLGETQLFCCQYGSIRPLEWMEWIHSSSKHMANSTPSTESIHSAQHVLGWRSPCSLMRLDRPNLGILGPSFVLQKRLWSLVLLFRPSRGEWFLISPLSLRVLTLQFQSKSCPWSFHFSIFYLCRVYSFLYVTNDGHRTTRSFIPETTRTKDHSDPWTP